MAIVTNYVSIDDFGIVLTTASPDAIKIFLLDQFKLIRLEVPNTDLLFVKLDKYVDQDDLLKMDNLDINLVKVYYNGERVVLSTIVKQMNIEIGRLYRSDEHGKFEHFYNATDKDHEEIFKIDTRTFVDNVLVRFVFV